MAEIGAADIGAHYRRSRERLTGMLSESGASDWETPVAACPGWRVRDVLAHLVGVVEDVNAGELRGPPSDAQTAAQVDRHRSRPTGELLARWAELAPRFEQGLTRPASWPAALDVGSHEQDVRAALSRPGARDDPLMVEGTRWLIDNVRFPAPIVFDLDGEVRRSRATDGAELHLRTTPFEVFRFLLGRRSRSQVAALDWSPAPDDRVLDGLFVFGPATESLVE